jgi:hypothetical protein
VNIEEQFKKAALSRHLCELTDTEGRKRIVQPYIIFTSSQGHRHFAVVQVEGYSSDPGDFPNWRNIPMNDIVAVKVLKDRFVPRSDYNPNNKSVYCDVHFKI